VRCCRLALKVGVRLGRDEHRGQEWGRIEWTVGNRSPSAYDKTSKEANCYFSNTGILVLSNTKIKERMIYTDSRG
jgi:hypothetical protein